MVYPHKNLRVIPRKAGKLVEVLKNVGLQVAGPDEWKDIESVERKLQSGESNDLRIVMNALKEKTLQFIHVDGVHADY